MTWTVERAAATLLRCERTRADRAPLTGEWTGLDLPTAYAIQGETLRHRLSRGEKLIGVKLGLTSEAKQRRMNVASPIVAWLTDAMALPAGAPVPRDRFIHPRVEPEIAFVMGERLVGPGVTAARAMAAVAEVFAGAEIIDSRYRDFRFTLPDVVADNASTGAFVLGPAGLKPGELDVVTETVLVEADGELVDSATGAAVQGHPGEALALAANDLATRGHAIEPGHLVLTGGLTDALPVEPGANIAFRFNHLGSIHLTGSL